MSRSPILLVLSKAVRLSLDSLDFTGQLSRKLLQGDHAVTRKG